MKCWLIILILFTACAEQAQESQETDHDVTEVQEWAEQRTLEIKQQRQRKAATIDSLYNVKGKSDAEIVIVTQESTAQDSLILALREMITDRVTITFYDTVRKKLRVYDTLQRRRYVEVHDTAYITDTIHLEMTVKDCRDCKKRRK